jgi:hypothetical protein
MVAFVSSYAPAEPATRSKNRAGDFFWWSGECAGFDRSATRTVAGENDRFSYDACRGPALPQKPDCDKLKELLRKGGADLKNAIKAALNGTGVTDAQLSSLATDIAFIGQNGGSLGKAMMSRTLFGGLDVSQRDNGLGATLGGGNIVGDFSHPMYHPSTDPVSAEEVQYYRGIGELALLNQGAGIMRETFVAHELGHSFIGVPDPFNVALVQNDIAASFRMAGFDEIHRTTYPNLSRTIYPEPNGRGGWDLPLIYESKTGFESVWRASSLNQWMGEFDKHKANVDAFIKQWGCE